MFNNQLILIHLTKGLFREFSVQKSVHSRYIVGTQSAGFQIHLKIKKPEIFRKSGFLRAGERTRTADRLITNLK